MIVKTDVVLVMNRLRSAYKQVKRVKISQLSSSPIFYALKETDRSNCFKLLKNSIAGSALYASSQL